MTTTTTNFKSIQLLRQWCMLTLPTVFNDALSYNEQVCKLTEAINEMATTINGLPDYIIELVKELLDQMNLEEIVKQVLADYFFINVKNPPAPLFGAKGDGIANDTAAIQAMIDYVAGKKTYLFFPGGIYSVNQLVMKTGVSLIGEDRYRTIINLEAASNVDLIGGDMGDCTIGNLTLSANMPGQTQNCSIYNGNVGDMLWYNVILKNAYDVMSMDMGSLVQMDNIIVDGTQGNGLMIGGERCTITNLDFVNTSELNNNTLLTLNSNYAVIDKITCFTAIKNGINVTGNYCWIDGIIQNAVTPVTNTGAGNVINVATANNNIVIKPQTSESYSGGLTVSAPSSTELIAGDKTVNANGVTVTANGAMELDGHNNVDITAGNNLTENVTGNVNVNAANITENATGNINLTSAELFLKPTNPLTYSKPVEVDKYFNGVPAKDVDGNPYTLLTEKDNTLVSDIEAIKKNKLGQMIYLTNEGTVYVNNPTIPQYQQAGTLDANYFYAGAITLDNQNQYIYKINRTTGEYTVKSYTTLGHLNGMTTDGEVLLATNWYDNTPQTSIVIINKTTLDIIATVPISQTIISLGYDEVTKTIYAYGGGSVYKVLRNNNTITVQFLTNITTPYEFAFQDMAAYNNLLYFGGTRPECVFVYDINGQYVESHNIYPFINLCEHRLGEMEGLEIIDGVMHVYSGYNCPAFFAVDNGSNNPTCMQFSYLDLNNPTAAYSYEIGRTSDRYVLYVDNTNTNIIRTGSQDNPFIDIYEAYYAAIGLMNFFGIGSYVHVIPSATPYEGCVMRGNAVQSLNSTGGTVSIKSLGLQFYTGTINNMKIVQGTSKAYACVILDSYCKVMNLTFDANMPSTGCTQVVRSICSFTGYVTPSTKEISLYNQFSLIDTYSKPPAGKYKIETSGTLGLVYGAAYALGVNVTTTPTKISNDKIIMATGLTRFNYFDFMVGGKVYTMNKSGTFTDGSNTFTIVIASDGITISATTNTTCDIYIRQ